MPFSHVLDRIDIAFDDRHAVANAGLILPATLASRLGLEKAADQIVDLGSRPGYFAPGAKVMTLVHAMLAGADCIDDADVLRAGASAAVLGHRVLAPSTLGTFLRSFTFGHVRQLDRLSEIMLTRAWAAGAGPGAAQLVVDIDSTICEVHGYQKQGAAYGYTKRRGYHPLIAARADTGEVIHTRMRKGSANSGRGAVRFVREVVARVRRAGACGPILMRMDSGFWSKDLIAACQKLGVEFSITIRQNTAVRAVIEDIDGAAWQPIDYTLGGIAEISESTYNGHRLVVRRTRLVGPQAELFPDWRHHAFLTDRQGKLVDVEADHRRHAVVELVIRDLKEGAGLRHCPSGRFSANAAWLVLSSLAHNLLRWVASLGLGHAGPVVAKTVRTRLIAVPGRLTCSARRLHLAMPHNWPWRADFLAARTCLRSLPAF